MKLHYFMDAPNFGDALNPWLWPQLLGHRLDHDASRLFLGIGTILKAGLPDAQAYYVLGAGAGYGAFPTIDSRWKTYAVRGPRTAHALGLPAELAATDGAALLRTVPLPAPHPGPSIGFMPHFRAMPHVPWRGLCDRLGLRYIDPLAPVPAVLAAIRGCDCLITEAMHGAIAADACRVPWVPVSTGNHVLGFKWADWMESLELSYPLRRIAALSRATTHRAGDHPLLRQARRGLNALTLGVGLLPLAHQLRQLRRQLDRRQLHPCLSRESVLQERTARLQRQLDRLRGDLDGAC
jgi:succinoglycan biosynthesis protein ExoV